MTDKKLTDSEVVKALECCTTNVASCKDCPAFVKVDRSNCKKYFRGALDLINRLQAENESWQAAYMTEKQEIANLEIELKAMRGAANSYKAEVKRLTKGIVHCADCQHCYIDYADQGFGYPTKPIRVCIIHDHETTLDDYCSWARRKDGDE